MIWVNQFFSQNVTPETSGDTQRRTTKEKIPPAQPTGTANQFQQRQIFLFEAWMNRDTPDEENVWIFGAPNKTAIFFLNLIFLRWDLFE